MYKLLCIKNIICLLIVFIYEYLQFEYAAYSYILVLIFSIAVSGLLNYKYLKQSGIKLILKSEILYIITNTVLYILLRLVLNGIYAGMHIEDNYAVYLGIFALLVFNVGSLIAMAVHIRKNRFIF